VKLRSTILNLSLALIYALVFLRCYVSFLWFNFEYVGYDLFHRAPSFIAGSVAIAVLPVLFYRGHRAVSSVIAVLIYLVLYVPIVLTFALGSSKPPEEITLIQLTFMLGMAVIFLADVVVIRNPLRLDLGIDLMPAVLGITALSTAYMLFTYRGSLQFSAFDNDLYLQRDANASLGAGLLMRYLSSWLTTVFAPLCLALGLTERRHRYTMVGAAACLAMYMASANKLSIILPVASVMFYLLLRNRLSVTLPLLTASLVLLVVGMLAIPNLGSSAFLGSALVLHRTIGNGGQLTSAYYDFFSFHQQTAYSHVRGLNLFTDPYPYGDLGLGQVVGQFYWTPSMNANANFWATDGIAAMGLPGVAFISLVAALLLVVLNSVTEEYNQLFVFLSFLPFVTTLLNQSLFSSFWSGGAFFLILFFAFDRRSAAPRRRSLLRPVVVAPS
jgi:hypothetical protein